MSMHNRCHYRRVMNKPRVNLTATEQSPFTLPLYNKQTGIKIGRYLNIAAGPNFHCAPSLACIQGCNYSNPLCKYLNVELELTKSIKQFHSHCCLCKTKNVWNVQLILKWAQKNTWLKYVWKNSIYWYMKRSEKGCDQIWRKYFI